MGEGEPGPPGGGKVGRNSAGGASLLSPPLHPSLYPAPAHQQPEGLPSPDQGGGGHQEDEWKNIQVKLFSRKKIDMTSCTGDAELHPGHGGEDTERADDPAATAVRGSESPNH